MGLMGLGRRLDDSSCADEFSVPFSAHFESSLKGVEVDVSQSESRMEALIPFKVVEQAPVEISFYGIALRDCAGH